MLTIVNKRLNKRKGKSTTKGGITADQCGKRLFLCLTYFVGYKKELLVLVQTVLEILQDLLRNGVLTFAVRTFFVMNNERPAL